MGIFQVRGKVMIMVWRPVMVLEREEGVKLEFNFKIRGMQINNIGMIWASVYVSTAGTEMKRREKVGGRNNDH